MSIQERLSNVYSNLQRKLFDQQIYLTGSSMEVVRLKVVEDKYHDEEIQVISNDTITIAMDIPAEIPLYRIRNQTITAGNPTASQEPIEKATSIFLYDILPIEGYSRFEDNVEKGDIIIRFFSDENEETDALILILRVSEVLGSFNANSLVWKRFQCAPHNLTLTTEIEQIISNL